MSAHLTAYAALVVAIVCETIGTSALQRSEQFTRLGPVAVLVVAYGVSFWMLSIALRDMPVGIAYAIWGALGIVLITLVGWLVFGQTIDLPALLGIGLIVAGVIVINVFSSSTFH